MSSGYTLDEKTLSYVKKVVKNYAEDLCEIAECEEAITELSYGHLRGIGYDHVAVSPTNNISRPTENNAMKIAEARERQDQAMSRVRAVDVGIIRAANTYKLEGIKDMENDLKENLINGKPREDFNRDTKTMTLYRKRAFYFIAEELGLL